MGGRGLEVGVIFHRSSTINFEGRGWKEKGEGDSFAYIPPLPPPPSPPAVGRLEFPPSLPEIFLAPKARIVLATKAKKKEFCLISRDVGGLKKHYSRPLPGKKIPE